MSNVSDFRPGDVVDLRGRGTVVTADARAVLVEPDDANLRMVRVPSELLVNLSKGEWKSSRPRQRLKPPDFREGDAVQLHGRGTVAVTDARYVYVMPYEHPLIISVPPDLLINLCDDLEMDEEEARDMLEDEL